MLASSRPRVTSGEEVSLVKESPTDGRTCLGLPPSYYRLLNKTSSLGTRSILRFSSDIFGGVMLTLKNLALALGYFEFFAVAKFLSSSEKELQESHQLLSNLFIADGKHLNDHQYIPSHSLKISLTTTFLCIFIARVKSLYCGYVLTLGLQRLTFAYSEGNMQVWMCLVAAHTIETGLWWSLALDDAFNTDKLGVLEIAVRAAKLQLPGGLLTSILLLGVPSLTLLFALSGFRTKSNKKKDV